MGDGFEFILYLKDLDKKGTDIGSSWTDDLAKSVKPVKGKMNGCAALDNLPAFCYSAAKTVEPLCGLTALFDTMGERDGNGERYARPPYRKQAVIFLDNLDYLTISKINSHAFSPLLFIGEEITSFVFSSTPSCNCKWRRPDPAQQ